MVTVFDIVTSPTFKNFQIISGEKGIQNPVSGTGIFDWESKADIAKSFRKGEFVITLMSSLAQEESSSISENCTWGVRKQFAKGVARMPFSSVLGFKRGVNG